MPPAFLDIVVAFALFRRSAINLPIIVTLFHNTILSPFLSCAPTLSPLRSYSWLSNTCTAASQEGRRAPMVTAKAKEEGAELLLVTDVTPVIEKEFQKANLAEWLRAPNSDELLRDLAITGSYLSLFIRLH